MKHVRTLRSSALIPLLCAALVATQTSFAAELPSAPTPQQTTPAANAPIPVPVRLARKLYVLPATWDPKFTADVNDLAIRFTTELTNCCGYTLVSSPAEADALVQLHGNAVEERSTIDGSTSYDLNQDLELHFLDPKTGVPLWSVSSAAQGLSRTNPKALQLSVDALFLQLRPLGTPSGTITTTAASQIANPKATPPANSAEATARQRLATAHTLYLQNLPADPTFPADPNLAFMNFTNAMSKWGRYTQAPSAATSDLVLQFQPVAASADGTTLGTPYLKLTLTDPTTLAPLWVITLPVQVGQTKKHVDLYAQSSQNVVTQLKLLAGQEPTKQEAEALNPQVGLRHPGMVVALAVAGPIVLTAGIIGLYQLESHKNSTPAAPTQTCTYYYQCH